MSINLKALTPNKVSTDFSSYSMLIYGTPKIGKSTFVNDLYGDKILQVFTEKRYKALEGAYVQYVSSWSEYLQVMKQLKDKELKEKFTAVSIDTVENLFHMLEKYVAAKYSENEIGERNDIFGKDWGELKSQWADGLSLIEKNGYVPVFVSHAIQVTTQIPKSAILPNQADGVQMNAVKKDGVEYMEFQKFTPDGKDRMMGPIRKMADNILFMNVTTDENGNEHRVINLRETLQWEAGVTFKNIRPVIELSADSYKKAVEEALGHVDKSVTTEERVSNADIKSEELDYDALMKEMKELAFKYAENNRQDDLKEITESVFGLGVKAMSATKAQVELVATMVDKLKEGLN